MPIGGLMTLLVPASEAQHSTRSAPAVTVVMLGPSREVSAVASTTVVGVASNGVLVSTPKMGSTETLPRVLVLKVTLNAPELPNRV